MHRYRTVVNVCVFIILISLTFNKQYNPFVENDLQTVTFMNVSKTEDALYKEIQAKSDRYRIEPKDAYIDRVWKKTPGRNGLQVNVTKSYEQMKKEGKFKESLLIYDKVPPHISLQELPASPIYRGHPEKNMVALLINVSWGTEYIPSILNTLKEHNIKATFFIEGKWAKENVDYVNMIDEQGHTIGNHAYNHPDMARLSNQAIVDQIVQTNEILQAITGKTPKWFAPPSGSFTEQVVQSAHHLNMETILWTVDTIDWKNPSVSVMMNRVISNIHPGATILMHPTHAVEHGLAQMITEIKNKGYKISTIDNLLSEER